LTTACKNAVEDGNNFGVEVQEECVSELHRVEDTGFTVLESTSKYHQIRAQLCHKMTKHSTLEDYREACLEYDRVQVEIIKLTVMDMCHNLYMLHDMLTKNLDKIIKPRTENSHGMY